jgi:hypothetical protein
VRQIRCELFEDLAADQGRVVAGGGGWRIFGFRGSTTTRAPGVFFLSKRQWRSGGGHAIGTSSSPAST